MSAPAESDTATNPDRDSVLGTVHSALKAHCSSATDSKNPTEMAQRSDPSAGVRVRGRQVSGATDHRLDTDRAVRPLHGPARKVAPQQQGAQLRSVLGFPGEPEDIFAIADRDLVAPRHKYADGRPVVGPKCVESVRPFALGVIDIEHGYARGASHGQAGRRAQVKQRVQRVQKGRSRSPGDLVADDDRWPGRRRSPRP